MAAYNLTILARDDIDQEADNIEDDDLAFRWVCDLYDGLEVLGNNPGIGHSRTDITKHDVLFWSYKRWAIIYQKSDPITVIRVVPWSRMTSRFWLGPGW